ncbi:MAG TPA: hypothetical protein VN520_24965 [Streptomyces sp.]|uniref:hypothetical protein n=1 Tax=Streptomyces sp. TaxID=1931 RepID=UPI002BD8F990|nr:hypothetical protein [Streptomyces sp.]HWU09588.1 hypothetical protein [Streptomyces sp.]
MTALAGGDGTKDIAFDAIAFVPGGGLGRFTSEIRLLDNDAYFVQTGFEYCDIKSVCNIT